MGLGREDWPTWGRSGGWRANRAISGRSTSLGYSAPLKTGRDITYRGPGPFRPALSSGDPLPPTEAFSGDEPEAFVAMLRHSFRSQFRDPVLAEELACYVPDDYGERSREFGFMIGDLTEFDLLDELQAVDVPTLVLYGNNEPRASLGGDAIMAAIRGAQRVIISEAGYFPFVEQPEAFLDAVCGFLSR